MKIVKRITGFTFAVVITIPFIIGFIKADMKEQGYTPAEPTPATSYISELDTTEIEIPCDVDLTAKTYMDYRKITDETSPQWEYIYSDAITVDEKGFLVTEDNFVGVALGSYFGPIGEKYQITLDSGIVLNVVKVEEKADMHTCEHNVMAGCNDVIEFVIDTQAEYMQNNVWDNGYIWQGNFNNCPDFTGDIQKIEKVIGYEDQV